MDSSDLSETSGRIFSGLSGSYDLVLDYATLRQDRRWKAWVTRAAGLESKMRVLDLGCGTCVLEEGMRRDVELIGLDLSREMLGIGKSKLLPGVGSLIHSDAQTLPFDSSTFDAVLSCYVVKYCDPMKFLSEASRVLKPGGKLVVYDFVRPRGSFWPANAIYTYGGLRMAGMLLGLAGTKNAYTFSTLPKIIETRPWEVGFAGLLRQNEFRQVEGRLLSGGVAMGFLAVKGTEPTGSNQA